MHFNLLITFLSTWEYETFLYGSDLNILKLRVQK